MLTNKRNFADEVNVVSPHYRVTLGFELEGPVQLAQLETQSGRLLEFEFVVQETGEHDFIVWSRELLLLHG